VSIFFSFFGPKARSSALWMTDEMTRPTCTSLLMSKEVFKLEGANNLNILFKQFPESVVKRVKKQGLGKAGARLRTLIRSDARKFKRTGTLIKSIKVKRHKNGTVSVGLKENFYYKMLDFKYPSGGPYREWFLKSVKRHAGSITQEMVNATRLALTVEAGKAYSRSKSNLRRK